ncbi:MAG: class III extradiol ring-cleavage dioxygenase [Sorangiineae bacterium]|nr:class III extradiol ring-cleavage dioxygenase [Polyangiaceae bacterium]MEB2324297.1 class III extradiol ring-cleavage dioxygenase [Sorangiineae bacterium]
MSSSAKLPVVYVPHGGGPWPFVEVAIGSPAEQAALAAYLRGLGALPREPPRAVLCVSAHWEEPAPTVMTAARPPLLFDYYGFPEESYHLTWPAPGAPEVAEQARALLAAAGFDPREAPARGFDHGAFVPLMLAWPEARVPAFQLSLIAGLDPAQHLALGRALAPLREAGVFIVASGMSYHDLRGFGGAGVSASEAFDAWLREVIVAPAAERDAALTSFARAPAARAAHPREEHLLPLMVAAGAAGDELGRIGFSGTLAGVRITAAHFGE